MPRTNTIYDNGMTLTAIELENGMIEVKDSRGNKVEMTQEQLADKIIEAINTRNAEIE